LSIEASSDPNDIEVKLDDYKDYDGAEFYIEKGLRGFVNQYMAEDYFKTK